MSTQINDEVEVLVHFSQGHLKPFRFLWHNRPYPVDSITTNYQIRDGGIHFLHFAVLSGGNLYQLVYHSTNHSWHLTAIEPNP